MFGQPKGRKIPQKPKAKNKMIYGIVVAVLMTVALISGRMKQQQEQAVVKSDAALQVHVIDVGQGDGILVIADGNAMLIDSGEPNAGYQVGDYLDTLGIKELEYVVATHLHSDHMGGFASSLSGRTVHCTAEPICPENLVPDDVVYHAYSRAVSDNSAKDCRKLTLQDGDSFSLGNAEIQVLAPADTDAGSLNNTSLVLRLQYDDIVCLFTGDMETDAEQALLERHPDISADLLKVAHHGSEYGTGEDFLNAVQPRFAAISCSIDNDYGHPAPETLERLHAVGAQVGITAEQGHLVYLYDAGTKQFTCIVQKPEGNT